MPNKLFASLLFFVVSLSPLSAQAQLVLDAQSKATIVVPDAPIPAEQTAARELADYLNRVTGASFAVVAEGEVPTTGPRFYVGQTRFAEKNGLHSNKLAAEEWAMKTVGDTLIFTGGRPRGGLYAVYRFLEDVVGVRWWTPWEEHVPERKALSIEALDRRGNPAFDYRDLYMSYGNDHGRFAARNRLNADGDSPISGEYGGGRKYGPPYLVHTFNLYMPAERYFAAHPEWFPLINGKRSAERTQLCLTNDRMREDFLKLVTTTIRDTRAQATAKNEPPPDTFSVSQNDWAGWCECENCAALVNREGSQAGPLFDFVNFIADGVRVEFPDVLIDTLAYQQTETPPKTIRPRDNVVVRLTDTTSNYLYPVTHERNKVTRQNIERWGAITKRLRIWDYAVTYNQPQGLPVPSASTYQPDYQFFRKNNVEGLFTEHEYPVTADLRDFKVWVMTKLQEDPEQDYDALVQTFTDGYYGPAGVHVRRYLAALEKAAQAKPGDINWYPSAVQWAKYLDQAFVRKATAVFDEAAKAVEGDEVLSRRVRHARFAVDLAVISFYSKLNQQWQLAGNASTSMPLDHDLHAKRLAQTWHEQIDLRIPENQRAAEKQTADVMIAQLVAGPKELVIPEQLRALPADSIFEYPPITMSDWSGVSKVVIDPDADIGVAKRVLLSDETPANREKYRLPMSWGVNGTVDKKMLGGVSVEAQHVPGPGYHWYKVGTFTLDKNYFAYLFWNWLIHIDVSDAVGEKNATRQVDVWARLKFAGPMFPHGKLTDPDAIYVERLIVTAAQAPVTP